MCWVGFFNDSKNSGYSIPSPANKYMLKVATKSLEITENISNENLFKQTTTGFVKNTFFAEHLRVTASVICMRVAPICNLNLYLQFVSINFTFSLLRVFTLAHALMSLNFFVDLLFGRVILSYALQDRF